MGGELDPSGKDIGQQEEEMLAAGLANPGDEEEIESEVTATTMGEDNIKTVKILSEKSSSLGGMSEVAARMTKDYSKGQDLESLPEDSETSFNEEPGEGMGGIGSKMAEKP